MKSIISDARRVIVAALSAALLALSPALALAQEGPRGTEDASAATAEQGARPRLPEAVTTRHELDLGDRRLTFTATAGALTLRNDGAEPEAEIAYVAYARETGAPERRPVTFVVNGGPGAASAYLHLGAIGPWRLPVGADTIAASQPVDLVPNAETWLDFTDLVFVDPVGTGFSRLIDRELQDRYLSIDGDADALARFVLQWLTEAERLDAPVHFAGESYGGFRAPLVAEALQTDVGVGLSGLVLISPVLDFGWWQQPDWNPLPAVALLPSLAAAAMEAEDGWSKSALEAAEGYATGAFATDLLRGPRDAAAVARIEARVAALTGLDASVVARYGGRLDRDGFASELFRDEGRIASAYDAAIASSDPVPWRPSGRAADPVLDALTAPLTRAALAHYAGTLGWLPDRPYRLLNQGISRAWDWADGWGQPEAVSALRRVLALDPALRVLVVHGATDLVTPYFASTLILRQLPDLGPDERVRQATYRGGHMFYVRDDARRAFREDARALIGDPRD